jgi:ribosome-associated protein
MADDDRTARQIARAKQRKAGDRSARLASALMKLAAHALDKLELDDGLREAIDRARNVTSHVARRRAERTLAGELRRFDLAEIDDQLEKLSEGNTEVQHFHLAERWRATMIEQGAAGAATFPGGVDDDLRRLIEGAQRERATGLPRGAGRLLFRRIIEILRAQKAE